MAKFDEYKRTTVVYYIGKEIILNINNVVTISVVLILYSTVIQLYIYISCDKRIHIYTYSFITGYWYSSLYYVVVQSLHLVWLFVTLWTAACQTLLSSTIPQSLLKIMPIELVMLSNHLILCHPLLLFLWSFSASRSFPVKTQKASSLCYTVGLYCLSISYVMICIC